MCGFTNIFLFDDKKFVRFVSFTHIINSFIYSFGMSDVNSKWWRRLVIYYYFVNNVNFPLQRNRYATVGDSKSSKKCQQVFLRVLQVNCTQFFDTMETKRDATSVQQVIHRSLTTRVCLHRNFCTKSNKCL